MNSIWRSKPYNDAVLFFRWRFFEMFSRFAFGSQVLGITLTSRAHGKARMFRLPVFPPRARCLFGQDDQSRYVWLSANRSKIPKSRGIVQARVVEVVTPGTAITKICWKHAKLPVSVSLGKKHCGLAWPISRLESFRLGK
jgi:DNA mismatch repair ATPase MutS